MRKLILGSAQFGLDYGLSGKMVEKSEVRKILDYAYDNGIGTIDTAVSYGSAHSVISALHGNRFEVNSKISGAPSEPMEFLGRVNELVRSIGVERIGTLFLHDSRILYNFEPNLLNSIVSDLKKTGVLGRFGISVYWPYEVVKALNNGYQIDIVQAPMNYFDSRFLKGLSYGDGLLFTNFQYRSIFLQGLLLRPMDTLHPYFLSWKDDISRYHDLVEKSANGRALDFLAGYIRRFSSESDLLVGVDSLEQLVEIVEAFKRAEVENMSANIKLGPPYEERLEGLVNPYLWLTH